MPNLADGETAWKVASRLRHLREDDFVGGFVLRRYERFTSAEARTWWVNGGCVLVSSHPDTPNDSPHLDVDLDAVAPMITALGLPFITVDLALRADGVWRVIDIGDGQVSDRPATTEPSKLITALLARTP
ncbi:ATP-grasp domain-containing protein [Micromonospora sp. IBSANI012]|uniref:ATP-grasp domain-containing protein n=1 Tax=Micromonospora sp. IBSANI012 TaxID=3457761 RepID=UPI0040592845